MTTKKATKEKKFNKAQAQITADKIMMIFQFVGMLDETDVKYLRGIKEQMEDHSGTLRAVQGVLVDYDRTEEKLKWNQQGAKRINGILAIREAMVETRDIETDFKEKDAQKEVIAKMMGL